MKNTKWKKLSRKILLKHSRLDVFEDKVELPDGHVTDYIHFGSGKGASLVIAERHDGKILLQREYSYPPNCWLYQFPGGAIEKSETPSQSAMRELAEEAGLSGSLKNLGFFYYDNRRSGGKIHVFTATELTPASAKKDAEEDIESYWFSKAKINRMIKDGEIVNISALAGWSMYNADSKLD